MTGAFWLAEPLKLVCLGAVAYVCGLLVQHRNARVNYTRKINFFAVYLIPMLVDHLLPYDATSAEAALRAVFFTSFLLFLTRPVRSRVPVAATMFASYDRPEDRPRTMFWLMTQLLAGYAVLIPMTHIFQQHGCGELIFIPIIVHGLGDGLAEPVGVRFGRHRYSVREFLGKRRHTRSIEGSSCVLIAVFVAVACFNGSFSMPQFIAALLGVPIVMTLAEACSPHTWDTPYMYLTGSFALLAIMKYF